ncbi:hypothetical protein [Leucobacter sp. wl10]|uniref:hypothetical protein n=1 Tax=Leucobacter sp. wl10 TaxID=2304677 RepID=UPI000E5C34ED|nr:hypothetical protein [Leucobacter sp. wl10]RGE20390.1 hypothetical protein D1J51_09430 [Leucobacter sp. wl10]
MSTTPDQALAADIESAILAVPGVAAVLRTGTAGAKIIDAGARLLGIRDVDAPLVSIDRTTEHLCVEVAIGALASEGVVGTIHRVHAVIDALILREIGTPADIRVTVAHIDESASAEQMRRRTTPA